MRFFLPLLLAVLLLTCCTGKDNSDTQQTPPASDDTAAAETQSPSTSPQPFEGCESVTSFIKINGVYYSDDDTACIGGMCDGTSVIAVGGGETYETSTYDGLFFIPVKVNKRKNTEYTLYCGNAEKSVTVAPSSGEFTDFYAGKDSQLFLTSHISDFTGENAFDDGMLAFLVKELAKRNEQAENMGARLIIAVVPNPQTLYGHLAPDTLKKGTPTRLEQLEKALEGTDIEFLNLTHTLKDELDSGFPLVSRTDTHWTEYAAFKAYEEIHKLIKEDIPDIKTYTLDDYKCEKVACIAGNFIDEGKEEYTESAYFFTPLFDGANPLYEKVMPYALQGAHIRDEYSVITENEDAPVCLLVRDSFSTSIMKFLANDFSLMHMQTMWQHTVDFDKAEEISADYIIHILNEANIAEILK